MPKPGSLPDFGINAGTRVQESRPGQQRLQAASQWHMGSGITKRRLRSCWSVEKAVTCMRESERTSWTFHFEHLLIFFCRASAYTTGSFQSHWLSTAENVLCFASFCRLFKRK